MRAILACVILSLAPGCGARPASGLDSTAISDGAPSRDHIDYVRDLRPRGLYRECPSNLSAGTPCTTAFARCFHPGMWCEPSEMGPTPSMSLYECQCSNGTVACQVVQPLDGEGCLALPPGTSCTYDSGRYPGGAMVQYQCTCRAGTWSCAPLGVRRDLGPDLFPCPPVASCNWCGGNEERDASGCVVGFTCANGVDPCQTQPCTSSNQVCESWEHCDQGSGLCWPKAYPDAGPPPVPCASSKMCMGDLNGNCSCTWSCSDGNTYEVSCTPGRGQTSCSCKIDSALAWTCVTTASSMDACGSQQCCGFPE